MSAVGTTTASIIDALNNLPNTYASKILADVIVDSMKNVTETLTNKTLTSPTITGPTISGTATIANITATGTLAQTGAVNVTGDVAVTGDLDISGEVHVGSGTPGQLVANAAITRGSAVYYINNAAATAYTLEAAEVGELITVKQIAATGNDHTVTIANATVDGANNILTFNTVNESITLLGTATTSFTVLANDGVALSS